MRQSVDTDGAVASSWLFDPDGTVLEGPDGPVSHLVCGGVYDGSTGLLYQGGGYFDPRLGIWLALLPLVVLQAWPGRKKRKGQPWVVVVCMGLFVMGTLAACSNTTVTPIPEVIDELCIERPEEIELSLTTHDTGMIRKDSFIGRGEQWQARLGESDEMTLTSENAGVYVYGRVSSNEHYDGEVKFIQLVSVYYKYTFADGYEKQIGNKGNDKTYYLDESEYARSPHGNPTLCLSGTGICGQFLDSPGSNLQIMRNLSDQEDPAPLEKFELDMAFKTYMVWYPAPKFTNCGMPLAVLDWSWGVEGTTFSKDETLITEYTYPWKWEMNDSSLNPKSGETKSITEPHPNLVIPNYSNIRTIQEQINTEIRDWIFIFGSQWY